MPQCVPCGGASRPWCPDGGAVPLSFEICFSVCVKKVKPLF